MASFWMMTNNEDKRNCITPLLYLVRGGFASAANARQSSVYKVFALQAAMACRPSARGDAAAFYGQRCQPQAVQGFTHSQCCFAGTVQMI